MIAWFVASHLISRFAGGGLLKLFLGNLMGDLKKLWGWLCHRSFWQLVCMGLAVYCGLQFLHLRSEQRHSAKVEQQLSKATGELNRLRAESKVQQVEVAKTVDHYITVEKPVIRKQVERIESAPLPGNCKTPQAVMEAGV